MEITKYLETEDGGCVFKATLTQPQLKALVEYALTDMIIKGLVPFTSEEDVDPVLVVTQDHKPQ